MPDCPEDYVKMPFYENEKLNFEAKNNSVHLYVTKTSSTIFPLEFSQFSGINLFIFGSETKDSIEIILDSSVTVPSLHMNNIILANFVSNNNSLTFGKVFITDSINKLEKFVPPVMETLNITGSRSFISAFNSQENAEVYIKDHINKITLKENGIDFSILGEEIVKNGTVSFLTLESEEYDMAFYYSGEDGGNLSICPTIVLLNRTVISFVQWDKKPSSDNCVIIECDSVDLLVDAYGYPEDLFEFKGAYNIIKKKSGYYCAFNKNKGSAKCPSSYTIFPYDESTVFDGFYEMSQEDDFVHIRIEGSDQTIMPTFSDICFFGMSVEFVGELEKQYVKYIGNKYPVKCMSLNYVCCDFNNEVSLEKFIGSDNSDINSVGSEIYIEEVEGSARFIEKLNLPRRSKAIISADIKIRGIVVYGNYTKIVYNREKSSIIDLNAWDVEVQVKQSTVVFSISIDGKETPTKFPSVFANFPSVIIGFDKSCFTESAYLSESKMKIGQIGTSMLTIQSDMPTAPNFADLPPEDEYVSYNFASSESIDHSYCFVPHGKSSSMCPKEMKVINYTSGVLIEEPITYYDDTQLYVDGAENESIVINTTGVRNLKMLSVSSEMQKVRFEGENEFDSLSLSDIILEYDEIEAKEISIQSCESKGELITVTQGGELGYSSSFLNVMKTGSLMMFRIEDSFNYVALDGKNTIKYGNFVLNKSFAENIYLHTNSPTLLIDYIGDTDANISFGVSLKVDVYCQVRFDSKWHNVSNPDFTTLSLSSDQGKFHVFTSKQGVPKVWEIKNYYVYSDFQGRYCFYPPTSTISDCGFGPTPILYNNEDPVKYNYKPYSNKLTFTIISSQDYQPTLDFTDVHVKVITFTNNSIEKQYVSIKSATQQNTLVFYNFGITFIDKFDAEILSLYNCTAKVSNNITARIIKGTIEAISTISNFVPLSTQLQIIGLGNLQEMKLYNKYIDFNVNSTNYRVQLTSVEPKIQISKTCEFNFAVIEEPSVNVGIFVSGYNNISVIFDPVCYKHETTKKVEFTKARTTKYIFISKEYSSFPALVSIPKASYTVTYDFKEDSEEGSYCMVPTGTKVACSTNYHKVEYPVDKPFDGSYLKPSSLGLYKFYLAGSFSVTNFVLKFNENETLAFISGDGDIQQVNLTSDSENVKFKGLIFDNVVFISTVKSFEVESFTAKHAYTTCKETSINVSDSSSVSNSSSFLNILQHMTLLTLDDNVQVIAYNDKFFGIKVNDTEYPVHTNSLQIITYSMQPTIAYNGTTNNISISAIITVPSYAAVTIEGWKQAMNLISEKSYITTSSGSFSLLINGNFPSSIIEADQGIISRSGYYCLATKDEKDKCPEDYTVILFENEQMFDNFEVTSDNELNLVTIGANSNMRPLISSSGINQANSIKINGTAKILGVKGKEIKTLNLIGSFMIEGEEFSCSDLSIRGFLDSSTDMNINLFKGDFNSLSRLSKHFVSNVSAVSFINEEAKIVFDSDFVSIGESKAKISNIYSLRMITNNNTFIDALGNVQSSTNLFLYVYGRESSVSFSEKCFEHEDWSNKLKITHNRKHVLTICSPFNRVPLFANVPKKASNVIYNFTSVDPHPETSSSYSSEEWTTITNSSSDSSQGNQGEETSSVSRKDKLIIIISASVLGFIAVIVIVVALVVFKTKKLKEKGKSEDIRSDNLYDSLLT